MYTLWQDQIKSLRKELFLILNHLFPDHGMSACWTFQGSAFFTAPMRDFFTALCTNTKSTRTIGTPFISA
jgi:hypothetical protein